MHRTTLSLTLLGAAAIAAAGMVATIAVPPACRLQVIPDYTLAVAYKAVLRLSPGCPDGTVLRVRKSSTMNTVRSGAPYQPIKPLKGAWEVGKRGDVTISQVPVNEVWTVLVPKPWRWEFFQSANGRWTAAEVLRAAP